MARTSGQELAIRQLRSIELASPLGLEIVDIGEPSAENPRMWARISLDCAGTEHDPSGIQLHERERISIGIDPDFPFDSPATWVRHGRWAGTPHVQWRRFLCLYAAPAVEWNPAGAMYSYVERLFQWLERAAAGTLDPEGAPLHPPPTPPPALRSSSRAPTLRRLAMGHGSVTWNSSTDTSVAMTSLAGSLTTTPRAS